MLTIRGMKAEDKAEIMGYVREFYHSDAVCHPVEEEVLERTFLQGIKGEGILQGLTLEDSTGIIGYAYVTQYYGCEVGGICVMIEEVFFDECSRGKGYGQAFFNWVQKAYPEGKRFRLEVTKSNERAIALYERLGFTLLDYGQMVLDRE